MILPELGGRIHVGYDKTTGYDFFYRNNVIKPALVGLAGPWISGGVEFNWPQHHRPATFLPGEATIEHERRRLGDRLVLRPRPVRPDEGHARRPPAARTRTVIELRVRLYNRTDEPQTLPLVGQRRRRASHDDYQSFFPDRRARRRRPRQARGHARSRPPTARTTASTTRPGATRTPADAPACRRPARLVPQHPGADLVHGAGHAGRLLRRLRPRRPGGLRALGRPPVAPGKKQWTWGNAPFGHAWDAQPHRRRRAVRRADGRRLHRQPADFSFLAPGRDQGVLPVLVPDPGDRPGRRRPASDAGARRPRRRRGDHRSRCDVARTPLARAPVVTVRAADGGAARGPDAGPRTRAGAGRSADRSTAGDPSTVELVDGRRETAAQLVHSAGAVATDGRPVPSRRASRPRPPTSPRSTSST